jgi:hypothetical protein
MVGNTLIPVMLSAAAAVAGADGLEVLHAMEAEVRLDCARYLSAADSAGQQLPRI